MLTPHRLCSSVVFHLLLIVVFISLSGCSSTPAFSQTACYPETLWLFSPDDNPQDKDLEKPPEYRPTVLYFDGRQRMYDFEAPQRREGRVYGIRGTHPIAGSNWSLELALMRIASEYTLKDSPLTSLGIDFFGIDRLGGVVIPVYGRYDVAVFSWLRPYVKAGLTYHILYRHEDLIIPDALSFNYNAELHSLGVEGGVGLRLIYKDFVMELSVDYGFNKGKMDIEYGFFNSPEMRYVIEDQMDHSDLGPKPRIYISVGMQF